MVLLVLVVAIINLMLGYALAVYTHPSAHRPQLRLPKRRKQTEPPSAEEPDTSESETESSSEPTPEPEPVSQTAPQPPGLSINRNAVVETQGNIQADAGVDPPASDTMSAIEIGEIGDQFGRMSSSLSAKRAAINELRTSGDVDGLLEMLEDVRSDTTEFIAKFSALAEQSLDDQALEEAIMTTLAQVETFLSNLDVLNLEDDLANGGDRLDRELDLLVQCTQSVNEIAGV